MTAVYLAGASADIDVCEAFMGDLRNAGCTITVDWCAAIRVEASRGNTDRSLSHLDRRHYAAADLDGVALADVVWLLVPPAGRSIGCWVELGAALASKKTVVVSGDTAASIFLDMADHRFASHAEAFAFITGPGVSLSSRTTRVEIARQALLAVATLSTQGSVCELAAEALRRTT